MGKIQLSQFPFIITFHYKYFLLHHVFLVDLPYKGTEKDEQKQAFTAFIRDLTL
ncbi:hypothetical protein JCM10512_4474 [Bacteroides reticulotermitis JCM 10512]|uniref:Uncharacterized protein n=1 Tax=Bacteroides reticulotermitis JCM 10512 TaxID=1445607 RepID=W4UYJ4_9BACE|nr:hypothetical protein JCM10512_4474 [Bacteroides reticulotermitis JCM 10512]